jgi:hypothetical protein
VTRIAYANNWLLRRTILTLGLLNPLVQKQLSISLCCLNGIIVADLKNHTQTYKYTLWKNTNISNVKEGATWQPLSIATCMSDY